MACVAIQTGQRFLATTLAHIDCQAQAIGSYGYGALADPGSPVSQALGALLTIFVAVFGLRLLLGYPFAGRDLVGDALKVALALTLATSWPAWRIVGYDLLINGPGEIAGAIGLAAQLPGSSGDLASRLQRVDEALAALNVYGSGRLGVATGDWFQLGFARSAFLTGTIGSLALVRLMTGILLALAPLLAGLVLFGITRSLFAGWAKALAAAFLASITLTLVLSAELALLEPWLQDALLRRAADEQTLEAPVELLVMTLGFALVAFGALAFVVRMAFHPSLSVTALVSPPAASARWDTEVRSVRSSPGADVARSHAHRIALSVSDSVRREERLTERMRESGTSGTPQGPASASAASAGPNVPGETLGGSWRRNTRRVSAAGQRRDRTG